MLVRIKFIMSAVAFNLFSLNFILINRKELLLEKNLSQRKKN